MTHRNTKLSHLLLTSLVVLPHICAYSGQTQEAIHPTPSFIKSLEWPKPSKNAVELWQGAYLGLHFAAGSGTMNERTTIDSSTYSPSLNNGSGQISTTVTHTAGYSNGSLTGSEADVFIGYNFHHADSRLVWGGQLEGTIFDNLIAKSIGTNNLTSTTTTQFYNSGTITSTTVSSAPQTYVLQRNVDIQSMFSFLGRGGFLLAPTTYLYGLIGGTEAHMAIPFYASANTGGGIANSVSVADTTGSKRNWWVLGWTTGVGLEYKITEHWSFSGEYRYLALHYSLNWQNPSSSSTISSTQDNTTTNANNSLSHASLNLNLGKAGVVYRI